MGFNKDVITVEKSGIIFQVVYGDITDEQVDGVVNPANSSLKHGGGIAGAIVRKGGEAIRSESDSIGYVPVGKAIYTVAGELPAKYVIHAVGPVWGEDDEERKLRSAVSSAIDLAVELGLEAVSIPAISTGVFCYPKKEGVKVIVDEVLKKVRERESSIKKIRFIACDDETVSLFKDIVSKKFSLK